MVQQRNRQFFAAGQTHVGLVRSSNQDAFLVDADSGLFIVADGMGGHNGGEIASQMAVDMTARFLRSDFAEGNRKSGHKRNDSPSHLLTQAFAEANSAVYRASRANLDLAGMGTTLIIAWMLDGSCHLAHVGDVRGSLFRNSTLTQYTRDHSTVATLVEAGHLTPEEARNHPLRHQIERAVGPFPQVDADITAFETQKDDVILLCTDGIWDMVPDPEIASVLENQKNLKKACSMLMERALSAGGRDNATLILVEIL